MASSCADRVQGGSTPLHLAARNGHAEVAMLLCVPNVRPTFLSSAEFRAGARSSVSLVVEIVERKIRYGKQL